MHKDKEIIPLASISNYFAIEITSPPPHRTKLGVDPDALTSALSASNTQDDRLQIAFIRNEPRVDVAPEKPGEVTEITASAESTHDKSVTSAVTINQRSGVIYLRIPYKDDQTKTPEQTAKTTTVGLHKSLSSVPIKKYLRYDIENDSVIEMADFIAKLFATAISPAICIPTFHITDIITNVPIELGVSDFLVPVIFGYSLYSIMSLLDAVQYRKGILYATNRSREHFAQMCAEDPRMALYPTILVHELLVPSLLYSLRTINKNIIVPNKKLRK